MRCSKWVVIGSQTQVEEGSRYKTPVYQNLQVARSGTLTHVARRPKGPVCISPQGAHAYWKRGRPECGAWSNNGKLRSECQDDE